MMVANAALPGHPLINKENGAILAPSPHEEESRILDQLL